ncbi:hypothetical protein CHLRE_13g573700v5 [Chlamydomonas reinhardtii]|uniref:Nucleotide-diphospho-sugar transferase domain-containing protein n=1 Tax=Chlamydomonas reinhardtii TaxID=3055 RepID=A0A2K3CZV2_CHLRE|nr:uncharacterized protein CHLRE_13g573700v5 [Chlamydomonas reinhardtii]PNW73812.1 hypothetical protein CHLRE_13g573700v5 [Chlamydomonas reinhardtii]
MFLRRVKGCRAPYSSDTSDEPARGPNTSDCDRGFVILTMGNDLVMRSMVPLLLESLQRIEHVGSDGGRDDLTRHTTVVGVTRHADEKCEDLRRSYSHSCTGDGGSGLYDGDNVYPSHKALAYGMVKLRYMVNALTTNLDIVYVDADTVFLRDPIPLLLRAAEEADADVVVATATAPCGSAAQAWDAEALDGSSSSSSSSSSSGSRGEGEADSSERHQSRRVLASAEDGEEEGGSEPRVDAGEGVRYATGLVLYRSTPAALRCAYSLLLDMASLASRGHSVGRGSPNSSDGSSSSEEEAVVWEQERFAAFMPTCMGALGRGLAALPTSAVLTTCGADAPSASELAKGSGGSGGVVAVHISSAPPGGGGEAGAVEASLAARVAVMKKVLGIEREEEGGKEERR